MENKPKPNPNPKMKPKPKQNPKKEKNNKPKPKSKPKPKQKPKQKPEKKDKGTFIIDTDESDRKNTNVYNEKIKNLVYKIKNQSLDTDYGIRFGWKNQ